MSWVEIVGYVASGLVLATFYMKTMVPLRYCAIASNGAFIAYGFFEAIYPVLVLHLLLLPLNVKRLLEIRQMIEEITRASTAGFSFEAMIPFMTKRTFRAGHALFRQGDTATNLYILCQGSVRLPEIAVTVTDRGALIGEIGLFSPSHERTTSAICETDVVALTLTQDKVVQLYYQNPRFGFALVQLVIQRLLADWSGSSGRGGAASRPGGIGRFPQIAEPF
jgi:CRP/FNR family transcriptional regulator, cyclic AMP receptor protein